MVLNIMEQDHLLVKSLTINTIWFKVFSVYCIYLLLIYGVFAGWQSCSEIFPQGRMLRKCKSWGASLYFKKTLLDSFPRENVKTEREIKESKLNWLAGIF